ncbi:MAG: hypothetical protein JEZ08_16360 [Clostridiales bacterium]|nr:hypothetical protein [Clostridiales bacterium]
MITLFFVEGIILLIAAILSQIPKFKSYRNESSYKIIEGIFIVIMIIAILFNVYISNAIDDSWSFPNVKAPYDTGVWTLIVFTLIYLYCFRELNLGGMVVTKERKWSSLTNKEIIKLYEIFITEVELLDAFDTQDLTLLFDMMCGVITSYGSVSINRIETEKLKFKIIFNNDEYYTNKSEVATLLKNINTVIKLKRGA